MSALVIEQHVNADVDAVFSKVTDFANSATRVEAITKVEMLTEGDVGLGTKFRETRVMFGREATEVMWVEEFERPARFVLGAESHGARYRTSYEFKPSGEGTKLVMSFDAQPVTFVAKVMHVLMKPLMTGAMKKAVSKDLADIAASIEGGSSSSS